MSKTGRKVRAVALSFVLWATVATADDGAAEDGAFFGPLRSRDLTLFGFLRLDMKPAHAVAIEPGAWALEMEFDYQNTWAESPEVEKYMTSIEPQGRHELGPADLQAIQALPGENYLVDVEVALLEATLHYKFSRLWTGYLTLGAVSYDGGFLDSTVEQFHSTFGFSTFGRKAASRNDVNLIFDLKSAQVAAFEQPTDGGFLDPTIGMRYVGLTLPSPWRLSLEAAIKVPVSGDRLLLSTGRTDYGLQASLQRLGQRHAFYVDTAAVYYAGTRSPVPQEAQVLPTLVLGYEYQMTTRTNLSLQAYISRSVYTNETTDLDELTGEKYLITFGLRHRIEDRWLLTFGITENTENINNTPDIGFQLGLAYIPHRVALPH